MDKTDKLMLYETMINNSFRCLDLNFQDMDDNDIKYLAEALKGSQITTLELANNNIGSNGFRHLSKILKNTQITDINLTSNDIGDEGLKHLVLKDTKITNIDLSWNNIGNEGVKHLAKTLKKSKATKTDVENDKSGCKCLKYITDIPKNIDIFWLPCVKYRKDSKLTYLNLESNNISDEGVICLAKSLKDTKLTYLNLAHNNIRDEGIIYLAECLKGTKLTYLNLKENKIGIEAAQYLTEMLSTANIQSSCFDIYDTEDCQTDEYISQSQWSSVYGGIEITLHSNKIGINGAQYLQNIFQTIPIAKLKLSKTNLEAEDAEYLAQAFKGIKIEKLRLHSQHILQPRRVEYLIQAFKASQIAKLDLSYQRIDVDCLVAFLKEIKVIHLGLNHCYIGDEGMKYFVPVLKSSDILYINLEGNDLYAEGIKYFAEILRYSKIIDINLSSNYIGAEGARNLANGLPFSQVMRINLDINMIERKGYQYLFNVFDKSNISSLSLNHNNIEPNTEVIGFRSDINSIAQKIRIAFEELVSFNHASNEFEFILAQEITDSSTYVDQCMVLFETFKKDPNSKAHVTDMICRRDEKDENYDMTMMNKVNEFLAQMPAKFHQFFENKLPDLLEAFENFDFVTLVLKFENMEQCDVVQNLLLHRVLYYVDENQEILHPYIYKLLHKYDMPLYNERLELNKKEKIISYFENHPEIDGAEEIIKFLESESFI